MVEYISGNENKVADCLSRLRHQENSLANENIFYVTRSKEKYDSRLEFRKVDKIIR